MSLRAYLGMVQSVEVSFYIVPEGFGKVRAISVHQEAKQNFAAAGRNNGRLLSVRFKPRHDESTLRFLD
jgi:hypothetical protein